MASDLMAAGGDTRGRLVGETANTLVRPPSVEPPEVVSEDGSGSGSGQWKEGRAAAPDSGRCARVLENKEKKIRSLLTLRRTLAGMLEY